MADASAWMPVATLVGGYGLKMFQDIVNERRSARHDREKREWEWRRARSERRNEFQRQTLLDLQDVHMDMQRAIGTVYLWDMGAFKRTGKWERTLLPEKDSNAHRLTQVRLAMLCVRAQDETLREMVGRVTRISNAMVFARSGDECERLANEAVDVGTKVNERIGVLVRELDAD